MCYCIADLKGILHFQKQMPMQDDPSSPSTPHSLHPAPAPGQRSRSAPTSHRMVQSAPHCRRLNNPQLHPHWTATSTLHPPQAAPLPPGTMTAPVQPLPAAHRPPFTYTSNRQLRSQHPALTFSTGGDDRAWAFHPCTLRPRACSVEAEPQAQIQRAVGPSCRACDLHNPLTHPSH